MSFRMEIFAETNFLCLSQHYPRAPYQLRHYSKFKKAQSHFCGSSIDGIREYHSSPVGKHIFFCCTFSFTLLTPEIEQPLLKSFNHFLVLSEFRGPSSAERRWNELLNLCNWKLAQFVKLLSIYKFLTYANTEPKLHDNKIHFKECSKN